MSGFVKRKGHDPVYDSLVALRHATDPEKAYAIAEGIENHVAALRALNVEAMEMLMDVGFERMGAGVYECRACRMWVVDKTRGHAPDCKLDALIQKASKP